LAVEQRSFRKRQSARVYKKKKKKKKNNPMYAASTSGVSRTHRIAAGLRGQSWRCSKPASISNW